MATLKIKKYGDPVLRKKTEVVSEIGSDIRKLAYDMLETMYSALGAGLAASQVGILLRLCVMDVDPKRNSPIIMVNPVVISSENRILGREGCLSFPGFYEDVKRYEKAVVQYTDLKGEKWEIETQGLLSRVVQHEVDHLDAKLFIDYLPAWKRKSIEKQIKKNIKKGSW